MRHRPVTPILFEEHGHDEWVAKCPGNPWSSSKIGHNGVGGLRNSIPDHTSQLSFLKLGDPDFRERSQGGPERAAGEFDPVADPPAVISPGCIGYQGAHRLSGPNRIAAGFQPGHDQQEAAFGSPLTDDPLRNLNPMGLRGCTEGGHYMLGQIVGIPNEIGQVHHNRNSSEAGVGPLS